MSLVLLTPVNRFIIRACLSSQFEVSVKMTIIHSFCVISTGLSFGCPKDCPALDRVNLAEEGAAGDYTFVSSVSFTADSNGGVVSITIRDDDEHEMREYFCLYVTDETKRGSQWYIRITIPWNDCKCFADLRLWPLQAASNHGIDLV